MFKPHENLCSLGFTCETLYEQVRIVVLFTSQAIITFLENTLVISGVQMSLFFTLHVLGSNWILIQCACSRFSLHFVLWQGESTLHSFTDRIIWDYSPAVNSGSKLDFLLNLGLIECF